MASFCHDVANEYVPCIASSRVSSFEDPGGPCRLRAPPLWRVALIIILALPLPLRPCIELVGGMLGSQQAQTYWLWALALPLGKLAKHALNESCAEHNFVHTMENKPLEFGFE